MQCRQLSRSSGSVTGPTFASKIAPIHRKPIISMHCYLIVLYWRVRLRLANVKTHFLSSSGLDYTFFALSRSLSLLGEGKWRCWWKTDSNLSMVGFSLYLQRSQLKQSPFEAFEKALKRVGRLSGQIWFKIQNLRNEKWQIKRGCRLRGKHCRANASKRQSAKKGRKVVTKNTGRGLSLDPSRVKLQVQSPTRRQREKKKIFFTKVFLLFPLMRKKR